MVKLIIKIMKSFHDLKTAHYLREWQTSQQRFPGPLFTCCTHTIYCHFKRQDTTSKPFTFINKAPVTTKLPFRWEERVLSSHISFCFSRIYSQETHNLKHFVSVCLFLVKITPLHEVSNIWHIKWLNYRTLLTYAPPLFWDTVLL